MHRLPRLTAACTGLALVLLLLPSVVGSVAHAQSVEELQAQQSEAEGALQDARQSQAGVASELDQAVGERDAAAADLSAATSAVDEILTRVDAVESEQAALQADVANLTAEAARTREALAGQIRELYMQGGADSLVLAFDAAEMSEVGNRSRYLASLNRADRGELEQLGVITTRLEGRQQELDAVDRELALVREQAEQTQQELDRQLFRAAGLADEVAGELAAVEADARALAQQANQAAAAVDQAVEAERQAAIAAAAEAARRAEVAAAAAAEATRRATLAANPAPTVAPDEPAESSGNDDQAAQTSGDSADDEPVESATAPATAPAPAPAPSPASPSSGGKFCPQANPRSFTDTWGAPRSGGRSHRGTDIFGTRGGNVHAIVSGTITRTSNGGLSGLMMILRGDDGNDYWYLHLQDFVASSGQRVEVGQLIAHNGDTGNARGTTPHIHFEYHPGGGGAVNPYPLLASIC